MDKQLHAYLDYARWESFNLSCFRKVTRASNP